MYATFFTNLFLLILRLSEIFLLIITFYTNTTTTERLC